MFGLRPVLHSHGMVEKLRHHDLVMETSVFLRGFKPFVPISENENFKT